MLQIYREYWFSEPLTKARFFVENRQPGIKPLIGGHSNILSAAGEHPPTPPPDDRARPQLFSCLIQ